MEGQVAPRRPAIVSKSVQIVEAIPEDSKSTFKFDVVASYKRQLLDDAVTMPIAAILALTELISNSSAETMYELLNDLRRGADLLKKATANPISLTAGSDLFIRFVTTARQDLGFTEHKANLVKEGIAYARNVSVNARDLIAGMALGFIPDEAVILTHSYSRVVMHTILHAHKRKRISVFVTEARPRGLGVRTYEALTAAGVPCALVLDSAVAYIMEKVDLVLVGSEAVVESGGLINAVGSYQMAMIARAASKPTYALAESYKFLRSFPLSQYDLPTPNAKILRVPTQRTSHVFKGTSPAPSVLSSPSIKASTIPPTPNRAVLPRTTSSGYFSPALIPTLTMSPEQLSLNPEVDYTRPELIANVISDVGVLTPSAVSQFLVQIYAD